MFTFLLSKQWSKYRHFAKHSKIRADTKRRLQNMAHTYLFVIVQRGKADTCEAEEIESPLQARAPLSPAYCSQARARHLRTRLFLVASSRAPERATCMSILSWCSDLTFARITWFAGVWLHVRNVEGKRATAKVEVASRWACRHFLPALTMLFKSSTSFTMPLWGAWSARN